MMKCRCISCSLTRALDKGEIPKHQVDVFLLGYYYFGMTHLATTEDAEWYAEGVDFYINEIIKYYPHNEEAKKFIKIIKEARE